MATFQKVKLGELLKNRSILEIQDGNHGELHPKTSDYVESGEKIPFVMANNIRNNNVDLENCKFIPKQLADQLRIGFAKTGDVLLTHKGTVGEVATIKQMSYPYIMLTPQVTYYRVNSEKLNPQFLSCYFRSPSFQSKFKQFNAQSTRAYVGITAQKQIEIEITDLPTQAKIASVLSAYDDLIKNNEKRIKILEEMAQLLYTEWFVKFKFPGYEKVKIMDSGKEYRMIPEGWEVKKLKKVTNIISGYAFKSSDFQETGIPVVKIKNITSNNTVDLGSTDFVSPEILTEKLSKYVLKDGDIIIAMTGATAGKIGRISTHQQMLLNQRVARINPKVGYYAFIWGSVETKEAQRIFYNLAGGAAQPNMSASQIEDVKILIPTNNLILWYEDLALPILKRINQFQKSNWILRRTRDLLIPQLVTGKRILTTYT